jgi:amino acid adenylation domain-containing protein
MKHEAFQTPGALSIEEKRAFAARLLRERAEARAGATPLVHHLIEAQAGRTPEAAAVTGGDSTLSYRELNERADRLALRLRALGVGREALVGLCVGRSPEMVVALLGVLKAGAAYVPLDPDYPTARLSYMLDDARVAVLLTEDRLRGRLPRADGTRVLCLEEPGEDGEGPGRDAPDGGATPDNLAYVIYTSGSTGRPKGVQVTHRCLAKLLQAMRSLLGPNGRDALLAVTTLSFDIAALELFLPLIVGARVELVERAEATDGARLASRLDDPALTFLQATPATWRLLLDAGWTGSPGLTMLCGGEPLPRALADRLLDRGRALWNLYGPTETTVWSSAWRVEPGTDEVAIGRPLKDTQI